MSKCRNCKISNHLMCIDINCTCMFYGSTHPLRRTRNPKLPEIEKQFEAFQDMIRLLDESGRHEMVMEVLKKANEMVPEEYRIDTKEFEK